MSAAVKLSELIARTRELADMESLSPDDGTSFVKDSPELVRTINRALRRLYDKLIIVRGDDYYAKSATITGIVNQSLYREADGFPADFMQLLTVICSDGSGGNRYDVPRWGYKDRAFLERLDVGGSSGIFLYRYRLVGSGIEFLPSVTTTAHTFTLHYIPCFEDLTEDDSTFDGVNGWEDWACYTAAIDLLNKEESFEQAAALSQQRAIVAEAIEALAGERDAGDPPEVQDIRKDWATRRYYRRSDTYD